MATVTERIFVGLAEARQGWCDGRTLPVLNVRDLNDGQVAPVGELATRPVAPNSDVGRYTVRASDVLVTCRGTQLKVASVTPASEGALISANLIAIRASDELLPAVLLAFLQSPEGQHALRQRGRSSTSSISLTPKAVGELSIPLPPLEVQRQIAELINSAAENYNAAIRAAEQRRAVASAIAVQLLCGAPRSGQD